MSVASITEVRPYLTFRLGVELYALDVTGVREVLDFTSVTRIPRTPPFMRGVINLRGAVVPVLDLRLAFGMEAHVEAEGSCIVVVEVAVGQDRIVVGALADSVEEVIELEPEQVQPAPALGSSINTDFIRGMGRRESEFILILDVDRIFQSEELAGLKEIAA